MQVNNAHKCRPNMCRSQYTCTVLYCHSASGDVSDSSDSPVERLFRNPDSPIEEGRARQVKVLIKNLAIFFLCLSKQFPQISFQIQLLEYFPQKQKEQRQKQLRY
jgi:hypothetical protein